MMKTSEEMKGRVNKAFGGKKYCVWVTTSGEGYPDVSFRGSTFVYDDEHIAFWDRSLGQSTTNLEKNPNVCMLYYDGPGRIGWPFYGKTSVYKEGDPRQNIFKRTAKAALDKDPKRKAYGKRLRIHEIRGHR